jgi:hypothetical protein
MICLIAEIKCIKYILILNLPRVALSFKKDPVCAVLFHK